MAVGTTSGQALRNTTELARRTEELGYRRFWVAEHHNMPAIASSAPAVLIAHLAAATSTIRVGSGGVMLPNHAPLVVAEQFGLLEAAYPGRIDLGLGRAPGSDPVTSWALRYGAGGVEDDAAARFPEYVGHVIAMLGRDGVGLDVRGRTYPLRATPVATSTPPVWLLGSSDFSARLAAERGLPYVFAHHFSGNGTAEALALYRDGFRPAAEGDRPTTFLTANVVVAASDEEAERLARPQLLAMLALRTGGELGPQLLVEEAEARVVPPEHEELFAAMRRRWLVGAADRVAAEIRALAERYDVDEVMAHPVAGAHTGTDPGSSPAREDSLRLLSQLL